jgi:hypothetical protein
MSPLIIERLLICAGEEPNEAKREVLVAAAKRIVELEDMRDMSTRVMGRMLESLHGRVAT